jgi:hypothetical protein
VEKRRQFDFWVGEWDGRWDGGHGTNVVTAELDDTVIFERFDGRPGTPLRGMSVSVFDAGEDVWKQTWVDSTGGYLDFAGEFDAGAMELRREAREDGALVPYRMRFTDIAADSFLWLWERKANGRWDVRWRIEYARRA